MCVCRGLQRGDGAIISMNIMPKGGREAYPGLSNDKFFFDTDQDMLELTQVGVNHCGGFLWDVLSDLQHLRNLCSPLKV